MHNEVMDLDLLAFKCDCLPISSLVLDLVIRLMANTGAAALLLNRPLPGYGPWEMGYCEKWTSDGSDRRYSWFMRRMKEMCKQII
jgi:hypothetical protein